MDAVDDLAFFRAAGDDGLCLDGVFADIEPEICLAFASIRTVALDAFVGKNRADVLVETQLFLGQGAAAKGRKKADPHSRSAAQSRVCQSENEHSYWGFRDYGRTVGFFQDLELVGTYAVNICSSAPLRYSKNRSSPNMNALNPYAAPASATPPPLDDISRQLEGLQYPLTLRFKLIALASQATITDSSGRTVLCIRQKMFKFREHVQVWADASQSTLLAEIKANKVLDWSARYFSTDATGQPIGSVGRRGWRSIFRAHYEAFNPGDDSPDFSIREENPWAKVMDSLLGQVPILGLLTGFFFHPAYLATRSNGMPTMRMTKQQAFFEGRFQFDKLGDLTPREELNLFLSFMMLVLLERSRG